ncbi:MAG: Type 1 glutamine amidotransferase-like domain-containing protein [Candidatus Saccharibacteria bacterium]
MRIAAIGGGDRRPVLEPIIAQLETPQAVIIPTACSTETSYNKKVPACAASLGELGLQTAVLHEYGEQPSADKIAELLGSASLAYVIGGNTPYLLKNLALQGSNQALIEFAERDGWLTGLSAGALLPFARGMSCPAAKPAETPWEYEYVHGLGVIPAAVTAHANQIDPHPSRQEQATRMDYFERTLPADTPIGFALENNAALVIDGSRAHVARALPEAALHVVRYGETLTDLRDDEQLSAIVNQLFAEAS